MKFTSKDLMKAMGLQVGDRIKIDNKIFEIYISPQNELRCINIHNSNNHFYFKNLIDKEIEIIPRPKRVGDLECEEIGCENCPLRMLCGITDTACFIGNLYGAFKEFIEKYTPSTHFDQEIYDLLKARLDKEVSVND